MIVQTAPNGAPHFVIPMAEHTAFAGALARAFGNDAFEPVAPREEMLYVIDHHDAGWADYDARRRGARRPDCRTTSSKPRSPTSSRHRSARRRSTPSATPTAG